VTDAAPIEPPNSGIAQNFPGPRLDRALDFIGRTAIAFLFVDAARYHLSHAGWHRTLDDMQARGLPAPQLLLVIAMVASTLFALALLFGVKQRPAALCLALYAIGVSLVMYNPFAHLGQGALVLFLKDLCIFGALLSLSRTLPNRGWLSRRLSE
jgi:putative oxidoreductase